MLLLLSFALADAIEGPPSSCPPGASGTSSHAGAWCEPSTCDGIFACEEDSSCTADVGLCVVSSVVPCGGLRPDMDTCTITKREALGPCKSNADCAEGVCEIERRCVRRASSRPLHPAGSPLCGCATGGTSLASGLLGLLLLGLLGRRRVSLR